MQHENCAIKVIYFTSCKAASTLNFHNAGRLHRVMTDPRESQPMSVVIQQ